MGMTRRERRKRIAAAVKAIRDFHTLGCKVAAMAPALKHGDTYGKYRIQQAAQRFKVSPYAALKARQFADLYSPDEVEALCREIETRQTHGDRSIFSHSHLLVIIRVPHKRDRSWLQRRAIREGWSRSILESETKKLYGLNRRPKSGRRPRIARDADGLKVQLGQLCNTVRRFCNAVIYSQALELLPPDAQEMLKGLGRLAGSLAQAAGVPTLVPDAAAQVESAGYG